MGVAVAAAGCRTPIALEPAPIGEQIADAHRSALVSERLSPWTERYLVAESIPVSFERETVDRLVALVEERPDAERLIALAEVAFAFGESRGGGAGEGWEAMAISALASWTAIFSGDLSLSPYDAAWGLARQLHNASLGQVVVGLSALPGLESGTFERPFLGRTIAIDYAWAAQHWSPAPFRRFYASDAFRVRGMRHRHRRFGIGATLIADRSAEPEMVVMPSERNLPIGYHSVSLSAVIPDVEFDGSAPWRPVRFGLEILDPMRAAASTIGGRSVPLESDFTAALVGTLAHDRPSASAGFGGLWSVDRWQELTGFYMIEPWDPNRIPVIFVHGLVSSPLTWREMFNDLLSIPEIRERYQFWFFMYPTGNPFPYSAMRLRQALRAIRELHDPDGTNARFDEMVVVGHSMGGLLARSLVTDLRNGLWESVSDAPLEEAELDPEDRALVEAIFFEPPLPWIRRVVFIAVPHRGSGLADLSISRFVSRLVRLPPDLVAATSRVFGAETPQRGEEVRTTRRVTTGIDSLSPRSRLVRGFAAMPIDSAVAVHSIIGRRDGSAEPGGSDGVVAFESAHWPSAESELIIAGADHGVPMHFDAVVEVLRILRLHLASLEAPPDRSPEETPTGD
ncbi:MAG TPA: alpha/beta hydrolase [Phycisphaerales bacterium]|nr:alpha/beta hydrolase [Phycisphaerales bacterium]HMP36597.1 alpha/beta hydrolase [Phycisphaerales bacterium]